MNFSFTKLLEKSFKKIFLIKKSKTRSELNESKIQQNINFLYDGKLNLAAPAPNLFTKDTEPKKIMCKIFMVFIPKSTNKNIKLKEFSSQDRGNGALVLPNFIFHHIRN